RKFLQMLHVIRLTKQRKSQLPGLDEIAVVNFQTLNRFELGWQQVEHFGVEGQPRDQNPETRRDDENHREPKEAAPCGDEAGDEFRVGQRRSRGSESESELFRAGGLTDERLGLRA